MCQPVSGYDCRLCLSVGKSPLGSAAHSKVHGVSAVPQENAIPEDRQKEKEKLSFTSFSKWWASFVE